MSTFESTFESTRPPMLFPIVWATSIDVPII